MIRVRVLFGVLIPLVILVTLTTVVTPAAAAGEAIGGTVDRNGTGITGIQIDLFTQNPDGTRGNYTESTTTDTNGNYTFNTTAGCWVTTFIAPQGDTFTSGEQYLNTNLCLTNGQTSTNNNATLTPTNNATSISGTVDRNGTGITGIQIDLFTQNPDGTRGNYTESTTTDTNGNYTFNTTAGCWVTTFIAPQGDTFTSGEQYLNTNLCLTNGQTSTNNNATLTPTNNATSISGTVDRNGTGITGIQIDLFTQNPDGTRGNYTESTTTDTNGNYTFNTTAGCWVITFIAPQGDTFTSGEQYLNTNLCLTNGQTSTNNNATLTPTNDPYFEIPPADIVGGDELFSWEFRPRLFPGIEIYALRFTQGTNQYYMEVPASYDPVIFSVTGDMLASEGFGDGLGSDMELIHEMADGTQTVVANYQDLFPLPVPLGQVGNEAPLVSDGNPTAGPLPLLPDGTLEIDAQGNIVEAVDIASFSTGGRCAVLQEGLPIATPPFAIAGQYARGRGVQFAGYVWVPRSDWGLRTVGAMTPQPWPVIWPPGSGLPPVPTGIAMAVPTTSIRHLRTSSAIPGGIVYSTVTVNELAVVVDAVQRRQVEVFDSEGQLIGAYWPIGVGNLTEPSQFSYGLAMDYEWRQAGPPDLAELNEPCRVFSDIGFFQRGNVYTPGLNSPYTIGGVELFGPTAELFAGLAISFIPGSDCVEAMVFGVTGWNAFGCLFEIATSGIPNEAFRSAGDLQFVIRRGDDPVGAIRGVNGTQFIDELIVEAGRVCSSFSPATEVLLADGSTLPISDLRPGVQVLSYDFVDEQTVTGTVTGAWDHPGELHDAKIGDDSVAITSNHLVWNVTDQEWQRIEHLDVGDLLLGADGSTEVFGGFGPSVGPPSDVYNLTVDGYHNYFVKVGDASVLVHNMAEACRIAETFGGRAGELVNKYPALASTLDNYATATNNVSARRLAQLLDRLDAGPNTPLNVAAIDNFISRGGSNAHELLQNKGINIIDVLCAVSLGGAYEIVRMGSDVVLYVGQTQNFQTRSEQHQRDIRRFGNPPNIELRPIEPQSDYDVRRGLEQDLYNRRWGDVPIADAQAQGSLNRQRPMATTNPKLALRGRYVQAYRAICGRAIAIG